MTSTPTRGRPDLSFATRGGRRTIPVRLGPLSLRMDVRGAFVCLAAAIATLLVAAADLASGDFVLTVGQVFAAFSDDGFTHTVVVEWRLPRVLSAVVFGAGLGVAGAIFQSLTRNPLASPDIIGFSTGSYTGALLVILVGGGTFQIAGGALAGGLATAAVVYVLAFRRGMQGFRLIIVGIAISAMLASLNTYLLLVSDHNAAISAAVWGAGSLGHITAEHLAWGGTAVAALLLASIPLGRPLGWLELGDDSAAALGVRVEPIRLALIFVGVALTAAVTAFAGPIAFIALAAPQIGIRLARSQGMALAPAACIGALLLTGADYVAEHVLPVALPIGVVTVVIGGVYLVWLLVIEGRRA